MNILLVGNPNVGKSAVFAALTGERAEIANFPGTTVEILRSRTARDVYIDSPGIYDLIGSEDEGRVTSELLAEADLVLNVVDALHLERDLYLTLELVETRLPLVIALNFADEARREGRVLLPEVLSRRLGVPVVLTAAIRGEGIEELRREIARAPSRGREQAVGIPRADLEGARERRRAADLLAESVIGVPGRPSPWREWLGRAALRPVTGLLLLLVTLFGLYFVLGYGVGQRVVAFGEGVLFERFYLPWIRHLGRSLGLRGLGYELILGNFGLLSQVPAYLFGLLLPLVASFYLVLSFLEDSGYLPRLAALLDRFFASLGLNGRAVIPFVLGLGCVTMATAGTRILTSRRERALATFLLALAVPCSAQMAVVSGLLGERGPQALAAYLGFLILTFLAAGFLAARLWPGNASDLLLDLPPLRLPTGRNLMSQTALKTGGFLREAGGVFAFGSLGLGLIQYRGWLGILERAAAPVFQYWLRLPPEVAPAFLMAMLRRDFGAAGLYGLRLSGGQAVVAAVTLTLFVPCLASLLLIFKERGLREGLLIWLSTFGLALGVGGLAARILGT